MSSFKDCLIESYLNNVALAKTIEEYTKITKDFEATKLEYEITEDDIQKIKKEQNDDDVEEFG